MGSMYRTARVGRKRRVTFEAVAALDDLCFPEDESVTWAKFKATYWWLVRRGGKIVGFASAGIYGDVCVLTKAAIDPAHRGHNLQQRLIEHRVAWARSMGLKQVWTYTVPNNAASSNNLIAAKFRVFKPESWPTGEAVMTGSFVHWRLRLGAEL